MNEIAHKARCTSTRKMFCSILGSVIETPEVFIVFVSHSRQMLGPYLDQAMVTSFTRYTNTRRHTVRVTDTPALYSEDASFESGLGLRLCWLRLFVQTNIAITPRLGYNPFLPSRLQFVIQYSLSDAT